MYQKVISDCIVLGHATAGGVSGPTPPHKATSRDASIA